MCGVTGNHVLNTALEAVLRITGSFPELHDKSAVGKAESLQRAEPRPRSPHRLTPLVLPCFQFAESPPLRATC